MKKYPKRKAIRKTSERKTINYPQKKLKLNEDDVFKLAQHGLTDAEICSLLGCKRTALENYRAIIQEGRANLSKSLKRTQLELALKEKNTTMLIWLGKQYAGQREKHETNHTFENPQVVFYGDDTQAISYQDSIEVENDAE